MLIHLGDNEDPAVLAAVHDLQADQHDVTGRVLPVASYGARAAHEGIVVCTMGAGDEPLIRREFRLDTDRLAGLCESFLLEQHDGTIVIVGSDPLGTVYGVYHACEHLLGVDPLKYWTDMPPAPRGLDEVMKRAEAPVFCGPPAIRLRGAFINEDDLITQFDDGDRHWDGDPRAHPRGLKSPYIVQNPEVFEGVITTLLRLRQNMVCAGTYVCPRDTRWRALMQTAAQRGLYNTTQHFQPVGCWPNSFDRYWAQRGRVEEYSWLNNRTALIEAWHAFAAHLAPLRPVWQVGYRGRDDNPFWESESGAPESREARAEVLSEIIAGQVRIIRQYDPDPACTWFLWAEGDALYRSGSLVLPDEVTVVFSDYGRTSMMKQAFQDHAPREDRRTGIYYHLGFWSTGPTNHMGVSTSKILDNMNRAFEKRATDYLLVNVASLREHLMGASAIFRIAVDGPGGPGETDEALDTRWCTQRWGPRDGAEAAPLYRRYFEALPRSPAPSAYPRFPKLLHDGVLHKLAQCVLDWIAAGDLSDDAYATPVTAAMMRSANLYGQIDEGQEQGFDVDRPEQMYFTRLDDFLDFVVTTGKAYVTQLQSLDADVEALADRMQTPGGGRFLRSHLGGQTAMMRMLAELAVGAARAAQALRRDRVDEARAILETADRNVDLNRRRWYEKYEGRFASWPTAQLCVCPEVKQQRIREILDRLGTGACDG